MCVFTTGGAQTDDDTLIRAETNGKDCAQYGLSLRQISQEFGFTYFVNGNNAREIRYEGGASFRVEFIAYHSDGSKASVAHCKDNFEEGTGNWFLSFRPNELSSLFIDRTSQSGSGTWF